MADTTLNIKFGSQGASASLADLQSVIQALNQASAGLQAISQSSQQSAAAGTQAAESYRAAASESLRLAQNTVSLAQTLKVSFEEAQRFSQALGLTGSEANGAANAFLQLERAGVSTQAQHKILREAFGLTEQQVIALTGALRRQEEAQREAQQEAKRTADEQQRLRQAQATSRQNAQSTIEVGRLTNQDFNQARDFSQRLGLDPQVTAAATRSLQQLQRAGADATTQQAELRNQFGLTKEQAEGLGQALKTTEGNQRENAGQGLALGGVLGQLAAGYFLVTQALQTLVGIGQAGYSLLIGQNEELQRSLNQTAASIAATNRLFDSQGGEITETVEAMNRLRPELEKLQPLIENTAANITGVTADQLREATNAVVTDVGVINGSLEETVNFAAGFLQTFQAAGIPAIQLRGELRAIANGQRLINSQVAQIIGQDELQRAAQLGTQLEFLQQQFGRFSAAGEANANLSVNAFSNIETALNRLLRTAGQDVTGQFQNLLSQIVQFVVENQSQIDAFADGLRRVLGAAFTAITEGAEVFLKTIEPGLQSLRDSLNENFVEGLVRIIQLLGELSQILISFGGQYANLFLEAGAALANTVGVIGDILEGLEAIGIELGSIGDLAQGFGERLFASTFPVLKTILEGLREINGFFEFIREQTRSDEEKEAADRARNAQAGRAAAIASVSEATKGLQGAQAGAALAAQQNNEEIELQTRRLTDLQARLENLNEQSKLQDTEISIEAIKRQAEVIERGLAGQERERDITLANTRAKKEELLAREEVQKQRLQEAQEVAAEAQRRTGAAAPPREFAEAVLRQQEALENTRLQLAQNRQQEISNIEQLQTQKLTEALDDANSVVKLAEQERLAIVEEGQAALETSDRDASIQRLQISREILADQLEIERERLMELEALDIGTGEGRRRQQQQILQAQIRIAQLTTEQLEQERQARNRILDLQIEDLSESVREATSIVQLGEQERLIIVEQSLNDLAATERQAALAKIEVSQDVVTAQLDQERQRLAILQQFEAETIEAQRRQEQEIIQAQTRIAQLTIQQLQNERQARTQLREIQLQNLRNISLENQDAIADQIAGIQQISEVERQRLENQQAGLERSQRLEQQALDSIERSTQLLEAQNELRALQRGIVEQQQSFETEGLEQALEIRRRLNDEQLDPRVRRELERQLQILTGQREQNEEGFQRRRVLRERNIIQQQIEAAQREADLRQQQIDQEFQAELARNELAQQRLAIEQSIAEIAQQTAELEAAGRTLEAEGRLAEVTQQVGGTRSEIENLRNQLAVLQETGADSQQILDTQRQIRTLERQEQGQTTQVSVAQDRLQNARALEQLTRSGRQNLAESFENQRQILEATQEQVSVRFQARVNAENQQRDQQERQFRLQLTEAGGRRRDIEDINFGEARLRENQASREQTRIPTATPEGSRIRIGGLPVVQLPEIPAPEITINVDNAQVVGALNTQIGLQRATIDALNRLTPTGISGLTGGILAIPAPVDIASEARGL